MPEKKDTFKQMGLIPHITVKLRRQKYGTYESI